MSLTTGIIGLPNVGKSTLFNALTKASVLAANYPFATLEPNIASVPVPDPRLLQIAKIVNPKKIVPTTFEMTDIAGLVRGASKGEGLGNQFLSHIRDVDALLHVVRCFTDENIVHVEGKIDPINDIETIDLELIFSDLETIERRIHKIEKKALATKDAALIIELTSLKKIHAQLLNTQPVRSMPLNAFENHLVKSYGLLTAKPMMIVANISEEDYLNNSLNPFVLSVFSHAKTHNVEVILISAKIESELMELSTDERKLFLESYAQSESGLDVLIRKAYALIGLKTFFTAGPKEARAWTYKTGMPASLCAGIIHSDIERGFIRAETLSYQDLMSCGSFLGAKEQGLLRSEGKEYLVEDGDILLFRFNV